MRLPIEVNLGNLYEEEQEELVKNMVMEISDEIILRHVVSTCADDAIVAAILEGGNDYLKGQLKEKLADGYPEEDPDAIHARALSETSEGDDLGDHPALDD